jgi:perosamine synthetase
MSGKHHTAGGQGGMITTNDHEVYVNAKRFADRGKPFESDSPTNLFMGLNYRMTDLEAAIGRVQFKRLPQFIENRRRLAARLEKNIKGLKAVRLAMGLPHAPSVFWFLRVFIDAAKLTVDKTTFSKALAAEGVPGAHTYTNIIYTQKWIAERNTFGTSQIPWTLPQVKQKYDYTGSCPNAEAANASHLLISINEGLTEQHMDVAAEALAKVEAAYLK